MATTARPPRRTQVERSAATRAHLLDATLSCLADLGYAGTTTIEIARRAGVSRGAQLHHFPTKHELVVTAVGHLFDRRREEFVTAIANLPPDANRLAGAIDLLWSTVCGPTFHPFLELLVAARTDPELRRSLVPFTQRFRDTVRDTFVDLFGASLPRGPFFDVAPQFAFALLEGLALGQLGADDPDDARRSVEALKALCALVLPTESPRT